MILSISPEIFRHPAARIPDAFLLYCVAAMVAQPRGAFYLPASYIKEMFGMEGRRLRDAARVLGANDPEAGPLIEWHKPEIDTERLSGRKGGRRNRASLVANQGIGHLFGRVLLNPKLRGLTLALNMNPDLERKFARGIIDLAYRYKRFHYHYKWNPNPGSRQCYPTSLRPTKIPKHGHILPESTLPRTRLCREAELTSENLRLPASASKEFRELWRRACIHRWELAGGCVSITMHQAKKCRWTPEEAKKLLAIMLDAEKKYGIPQVLHAVRRWVRTRNPYPDFTQCS